MRSDIAAAWSKVSNKVGKKRDVKKLPEYLNGGEVVLAMTGGRVAGNNGLLVATDRRALFVADGSCQPLWDRFFMDSLSRRGLLSAC